MSSLFIKLYSLILGIVFVPFRRVLKMRDIWLFGSDKGYRYTHNSKYLFEYVLKNHPEIEAYWMTRSKEVYLDMKRQNLPVIFTVSLQGILYSLTAKVKIVSTWFDDILYTFYDKRQKVAYLMHGIAPKKIYYDNIPKKKPKQTLFSWSKTKIARLFLENYKLEYSCFTPVPSYYLKDLMVKAMHNDNIYVVGQPRTDAFFQLDANSIKDKYGIDRDKLVITYMPTHRSYGFGEPSPHLFIKNDEAIQFFNDNNICMIWKQHINMLRKYKYIKADSCFVEKSFDPTVDPQELLLITDLLITDFSSCFIDFMLLKRPILFYHYDNYEKEDNDLYYGEEILSKIGNVSKNETELLNDIKNSLSQKETIDYEKNWKIFNEYYDDRVCERCYTILKRIIDESAAR